MCNFSHQMSQGTTKWLFSFLSLFFSSNLSLLFSCCLFLTDFQIPTVSVLCNFPKIGAHESLSSSLLSVHEAETFFHEFGHACHNLLSRTKFQHTAGIFSQFNFLKMKDLKKWCLNFM